MLGVAFCLLFGYVAAQTQYYLGDPKIVTVDARMFTKKVGIEVHVTRFWMKFPGAGTNVIDFKSMGVQIIKDLRPRNIHLECDFGTMNKPLALPSYVSGSNLVIMAEGNVMRNNKIVENSTVATVLNVTFARHIQYTIARGEVSKVANLRTKFNITVSNLANVSASDWVVNLVYKSGTSFDLFASMNVTKATTNAGFPFTTLEGKWNKPSTPMKTDLRLLVGIKNGSYPFNTYAIANNDVSSARYAFVVVGDTFKLTAPASIPEYNVTNITLNGGGVTNSYWWIIAQDQSTRAQYALNCASQLDTDFQNFEWFVQPIGKKTYPYLPVGTYNLHVVWTPSPTRDANGSVNYPTMMNAAMMQVTSHANMAPTPISFNRNSGQKLGRIQEGTTISVEVYSVFSMIHVQWFQLANSSNYTNSTNGNGTRGWEAIAGTKEPFSMTPGKTQMLKLTVPNGINLSFSDQVRLFGWTEDCDKNHFGQIYANGNVTSPPAPAPAPSSSKSPLGPGAIVGIVCAVVFVCGVAAWWLCMRKQPTQDRYQKLEK